MRPLLSRFSLFALLASLALFSGCGSLLAKGPQSTVDMDIWSEDCHPYTFPTGLKTITPESPNNAVMDPKMAPALAVIRSAPTAAAASESSSSYRQELRAWTPPDRSCGKATPSRTFRRLWLSR